MVAQSTPVQASTEAGPSPLDFRARLGPVKALAPLDPLRELTACSALSADPQVRGAAFERFRLLENRRREPWVSESLTYLNHPLREADSERFIRPCLELLAEIQRTGDIFFPGAWTGSML